VVTCTEDGFGSGFAACHSGAARSAEPGIGLEWPKPIPGSTLRVAPE